jgi:hypothetical protein
MNANHFNQGKSKERWIGAVLVSLVVLALFVVCWAAAVVLCGAGCAVRKQPAGPTGSRPQERENDPSTVVKSPIAEKLREARAQVMEMPVLTAAPAKPSFPKIRIVPLIFPPGTGSNLNWDVWESHDSKTWTVIERNIYPLNHCVWPTSNPSFYRIVGRQN